MTLRGLSFVSALVLSVCTISSSVQAQSKFDVFAGYSFGTNRNCSFQCGGQGLHGYSAAAAYNFNKYIGIEASASGHNGTTTVYAETPTATSTGYLETLSQDVYVFTFGPKLTLPVKDFSLFSHFLVGLNHVHDGFTEKCLPATGSAGSCGNSYYSTRGGGNGMAAKFGGGVEWNHGRFGIRILEVDYIYGQVSGTQYYNSSGTPYQEFRSGTGGGFELATGLTIHFGGK